MTTGATGLKAIILAGGKGTRLRPFTASFPKPLVPLGDTPVVEVLIKRLIEFGVTDVTMTLGHLAELMRAYFIQRQELTSKLNLDFVIEHTPTGTAGSVSLVEKLTDTFLVMNGDLLTDLNFHELVDFHRRKKAMLTIATRKREVKIDLGVLEYNQDNEITAYREKPTTTYDVSMGVYVYQPEVLKFIERGQRLDLPDLVLRLIAAGERVCSFSTDCQWLDIGRPDDYARAQELYADRPESFDRV